MRPARELMSLTESAQADAATAADVSQGLMQLIRDQPELLVLFEQWALAVRDFWLFTEVCCLMYSQLRIEPAPLGPSISRLMRVGRCGLGGVMVRRTGCIGRFEPIWADCHEIYGSTLLRIAAAQSGRDAA